MLVLKTSSPDSVVRQWSITADIVKALQTDKVQLIKTLILHPGLGHTTYRWDCKPNSLNLLHSGTRHWGKQGWESKWSQFGMCCPIQHTARNSGDQAQDPLVPNWLFTTLCLPQQHVTNSIPSGWEKERLPSWKTLPNQSYYFYH